MAQKRLENITNRSAVKFYIILYPFRMLSKALFIRYGSKKLGIETSDRFKIFENIKYFVKNVEGLEK